jgi:hypothetical protein
MILSKIVSGAVALLLKAALIHVSDNRLLGASGLSTTEVKMYFMKRKFKQ